GEGEPRKTQQVEGPPPAVVLPDPAAEKESGAAADGDSRGVDPLDGRTNAGRKEIAQQRQRRGSERRLTDADHDPAEEEGPEAVGEAGEAGEEGPHRKAAGDEVLAHHAVG